MRPIDADALIEKCGDWYVEEGTESGFIGTLKNLLATEPNIQPERTEERTETLGVCLDAISRQAAIDVLNEYFARIGKLKRRGLTKGEEAISLDTVGAIKTLPPVQPEPAIPVTWIEKYIEWLKSFDNEFANLEAAHISVMMKKWRDEQDETN